MTAEDDSSEPIAPLATSQPTPEPKQSHLISRILSPAIQLWLRSQAEQVDHLQVQIEGGDRQLLSGYISQVRISAQKAVYQGLHLSEIHLSGTEIRINIGQMLRGKPFQLLQVVPVQGELRMEQADLNASLQAPLLKTAVTEFLETLLRSSLVDDASGDPDNLTLQLHHPQIVIAANQLTISIDWLTSTGKTTPVTIRTGLGLANSHTLRLEHPQLLTSPQAKRGLPLKDLHGFSVDLGMDVELKDILLMEQQLLCRGTISIRTMD